MSEYKVYSAPVKSFWCCLPNLALHLWSSITHARVPSIRNRPFFPLLVKTSASWKHPAFKQVTIVPGLVETRAWPHQWLEEKCLRIGSLLRKPSRTWGWWYFPIRRQEGRSQLGWVSHQRSGWPGWSLPVALYPVLHSCYVTCDLHSLSGTLAVSRWTGPEKTGSWVCSVTLCNVI